MINSLRRFLYKIVQAPHQLDMGSTPTDQSMDYTEMISNDLQKKYEDKLISIPIQFVHFDAILASLSAGDHPGIQKTVTRPYVVEDFKDLNDDIAEVITDYMNTHLKLIVNAAIQEYLNEDKIKMSVDDNGIKYYTEEEDEDADELITLERNFRSV